MGPVDTDPLATRTASPRTRRLVATGAVAAVVGMTWVVRVTAHGRPKEVAGSLLELGVLAALVVWAVATWLPVREIAAGIGRWRVAVILCLVVGVLAGQHLRSENLYPFKRWDMYTVPTEASGYLELRMSARGDDLGVLPLADTVPTTSVRAYLSGLHAVMAGAAAGDPESLRVATAAMQGAIDELGRDDVEVVVVRQCLVDHPTTEAPSDCTLLLEVPVRPAGEPAP